MNKTEWNESADPDLMLRLILQGARDERLRMFACACCRRIWHLLEDRRLRDALRIAEKFARGKTTLAKLEVASWLARDASEQTDLAEWIAEAEAGFSPSERYCVFNARKYAAYTVIAAASPRAVELDFGICLSDHRIRGSHTWAAAARSCMAVACVLEYFRGPENEAIGEFTSLASDSAKDAERKAQADILRRLFEHPSQNTRSIDSR